MPCAVYRRQFDRAFLPATVFTLCESAPVGRVPLRRKYTHVGEYTFSKSTPMGEVPLRRKYTHLGEYT